ncbi:MAG: hypothetical protein HQM14_09865 [SAR324 cluster bacterium]|nr:hypothetical protein [SAR324 cluster bacterium]
MKLSFPEKLLQHGIILLLLPLFTSCVADHSAQFQEGDDASYNSGKTQLLLVEGSEDFDIGAERVFYGKIEGDVVNSTEETLVLKDPDGKFLTQSNGEYYQIQTEENGKFVIEAEFPQNRLGNPLIIEAFSTKELSISNISTLLPLRSAPILFETGSLSEGDQISVSISVSPITSLIAKKLAHHPAVKLSQHQQEIAFQLDLPIDQIQQHPIENSESIQVVYALELLVEMLQEGSSFLIQDDHLFQLWGTNNRSLIAFDTEQGKLELLPEIGDFSEVETLTVTQAGRLSLLFQTASTILEQLAYQAASIESLSTPSRFSRNLSAGEVTQSEFALVSGKNNLLKASKNITSLIIKEENATPGEFKIYVHGMVIPVRQKLEDLLQSPTTDFVNLDNMALLDKLELFEISETDYQSRLRMISASIQDERSLLSQLATNRDLSIQELESLVEWGISTLGKEGLDERVLEQVSAKILTQEMLASLKARLESSNLSNHMDFSELMHSAIQVLDPTLKEFMTILLKRPDRVDLLEKQLLENQGDLLEITAALGQLNMTTLDLLIRYLGDSQPDLLQKILSDPQEIHQHINVSQLLYPIFGQIFDANSDLPPVESIHQLEQSLENKFIEFSDSYTQVTFSSADTFWKFFEYEYRRRRLSMGI